MNFEVSLPSLFSGKICSIWKRNSQNYYAAAMETKSMGAKDLSELTLK